MVERTERSNGRSGGRRGGQSGGRTVGRADGRAVGWTDGYRSVGARSPTIPRLTRLRRLTKNRHALISWVVFQTKGSSQPSHACFLKNDHQEYLKCVANLGGNLSNLKAVEAEQEKLFFEEKRRIVVEALKNTVRAFHPQPLLEVFQDQFKVIRSRYNFFVVNGDSCTGKTVWAKHITGNTSEVFYVNCASCPEPDLRLLKAYHKVILLDEASPDMILSQKLLIQGPPDFVSLGCSTTNCHAYQVFVSGIQFVICSNKWLSEVENLECVEDREWLRANSIVLDVGKVPMFI